MHIEYTISEQDYATAQKLAMKSIKPLHRRPTLQVLPALGLLTLGFMVYTISNQGFSSHQLPAFILPSFLVALPFFNKKAIRASYAKATNMHGSLVLDVDDDDMHFQGPTFDSRVTWAHYSRFFEDDNSFILVQSSLIFNIIPKRFLSGEKISELRDLLSRRIHNSTG